MRDRIAKAFLRAAGDALAGSLLKETAATASTQGAHDTANLARAVHGALAPRAAQGRDELQRHLRQAAGKGSSGPGLRLALYDLAAQLLDGPQPSQREAAGPAASQCFLLGVRERNAGNAAAARHWFERGAAQGDPDCRRYLPAPESSAVVPARPAQLAGHAADSAGYRVQALEVLGLRDSATADEIRAAYQRLMQQLHPDKGGSEFFAKQLNLARQTLLG